jgi:hypothetical protein
MSIMSASRISRTAHTSMSDRHTRDRAVQRQKAAQREHDRQVEEDEAEHARAGKQAQSSWRAGHHVDRTA